MSTCAICVEDTESPVCCVPCGHVYCRECIDIWQKSEKSVSKCPECREKIKNVMAIYIKRYDTKDDVKVLMKKIDILKRTLKDCDQEKRRLENNLKEHRENDLNYKNSSTSKLEEQKKQIDMYKEKMKNELEKSMVGKEKLKTLKESIQYYQDKMVNLRTEIKHLKDCLQKEENKFEIDLGNLTESVRRPDNVTKTSVDKKVQTDRWLMKSAKSSDNVEVQMSGLEGFLAMVVVFIVLGVTMYLIKSSYDYGYLTKEVIAVVLVIVISIAGSGPPQTNNMRQRDQRVV